jgi:hypothetical protein
LHLAILHSHPYHFSSRHQQPPSPPRSPSSSCRAAPRHSFHGAQLAELLQWRPPFLPRRCPCFSRLPLPAPEHAGQTKSPWIHGAGEARAAKLPAMALAPCREQFPWPTPNRAAMAELPGSTPVPLLSPWPPAAMAASPRRARVLLSGRPAPCPRRPGIPTAAPPSPAPSLPWRVEPFLLPWMRPPSSLFPWSSSARNRILLLLCAGRPCSMPTPPWYSCPPLHSAQQQHLPPPKLLSPWPDPPVMDAPCFLPAQLHFPHDCELPIWPPSTRVLGPPSAVSTDPRSSAGLQQGAPSSLSSMVPAGCSAKCAASRAMQQPIRDVVKTLGEKPRCS